MSTIWPAYSLCPVINTILAFEYVQKRKQISENRLVWNPPYSKNINNFSFSILIFTARLYPIPEECLTCIFLWTEGVHWGFYHLETTVSTILPGWFYDFTKLKWGWIGRKIGYLWSCRGLLFLGVLFGIRTLQKKLDFLWRNPFFATFGYKSTHPNQRV